MGIENPFRKIFKKDKKPSTIEFELDENGKLKPIFRDPSSELNDPLPSVKQVLNSEAEAPPEKLKTVDQFLLENPNAVVLDLIKNPDTSTSGILLAIKGVTTPHVIIENTEDPITMEFTKTVVGIVSDDFGSRITHLTTDPINFEPIS